MSKAVVTRLFVAAGFAMIAGAVAAVAALWSAFANDAFVMNGSAIVGLRASALGWASLGLGVVGMLAIVGGMVAGLVAWIGALLNTAQLESKAWFIGLLLLGIFNLGFLAMVAYVISGPDGSPPPKAQATPAIAAA
jgi:hypothetical protein